MPTWLASDFTGTQWSERRIYAIYVCPTGNDGANNDGSPKRPFRTVAKAVAVAIARNTLSGITGDVYRYVIAGGGSYPNETFVGHLVHIIGDEGAIIELNGGGQIGLESSTTGNVNLKITNLVLRSYIGLAAMGANGGSSHTLTVTATNCKFYSVLRPAGRLQFQSNYTFVYDTCQFQDSYQQIVPGETQIGGFYRNTFDNCTIKNSNLKFVSPGGPNDIFILRNSIIDPLTTLFISSYGTWIVINNNIQSTNIVKGIGGAASGNFHPLTTVTYANIAAAQAANPGAIANNTALAPGFVNEAAGDFALALDSPLRYSSTTSSYLGAFGPGLRHVGQAAAAQVINLTWNATADAYELTNPANPGTLESTPLDYGGPQTIAQFVFEGQEDVTDLQTVDASLSYETSNGQAVDFGTGPFTSAQYGNTYWNKGYSNIAYNGLNYPNNSFLVVNPTASSQQPVFTGSGQLVRITEIPNIRTLGVKYTLGNLASLDAAEWKYFIYNKQATVDAQQRANGHPDYDPTTGRPLALTYSKFLQTIQSKSLA